MAMLDTLLSYSLQDLLLFSPEVYWHLLADFVRAQQTQMFWLALTSLAALATLYRTQWHGIASVLLGLLWAYCGWQFYRLHYTSINPLLAPMLAWVCYAQAVLTLLWAAWWQWQPSPAGRPPIPARRPAFIALCLLIIAGLLSALLSSQGQAMYGPPGLLPLPTALFSLLMVCGLNGRARFWLLPLALLLLTIESTTLQLLNAPRWWLAPALGLMLLGAAVYPRPH